MNLMPSRVSNAVLLLSIWGASLFADDLPKGQVIPEVRCVADASQTYALYLPSHYSPERRWNLILAFDPGGRGLRPVERYQAAAEKYGYIIAGSNNSRNGPWDISLAAAEAMRKDVVDRFKIDSQRMYTAGLSGGARVAIKLAQDDKQFAGVIASSAGFPDDQPHSLLNFVIFATAGTEDFNNLEMHQLDRTVTTSHRLVVFNGGHTWLPAELTDQALGWMELQAMKFNRRTKDETLIDQLFAARIARVGDKNDGDELRELRSLVTDFNGLRDVAKYKEKAAALEHQKSVKDSVEKEIGIERAEEKENADLYRLIGRLNARPDIRDASFESLKTMLVNLSAQAESPEDSQERRMARRLLGGVVAGSRGVRDEAFQQLIARIRPSARLQER